MNRRTNKVSGWVNFPVDSKEWKSSQEGGMFVKLVVLNGDPSEHQCCGVCIHDILCEQFIGNDQVERPRTNDDVFVEIEERKKWEEVHYPCLNTEGYSDSKYMSVPYLAAIVMGSTGWSGWSETQGLYWICRRNDLTEEGLAIYGLMKRLYPDNPIHLLTFLDT